MERRDKNKRERLVREWQESGERKSDFASRHGIGSSTFYHWTKKLKSPSRTSKSNDGFQAITIQEEDPIRQYRPMAIIHYPSGTTLEIYTPVDAKHLKSLIR